MADNAPPPAAPRRPLGIGYLVFAGVVLAVAVVFIIAPDLPRSLAGSPPPAGEPGPEPQTGMGMDTGALASKEHQDRVRDLAAVSIAQPTPEIKKTVITPTVTTERAVGRDEKAGQQILASAEKAYREMKWDEAVSIARRLEGMDLVPATRGRGKDIVRGAPELKKLFKALDDRDELSRNYDTHPALVRIDAGGQPIEAVPIQEMGNPEPVAGDPVQWIETQKATGKVALLMKGARQFSPGELMADRIVKVTLVDQAAVRRDKALQLDLRLGALRNNAAAQANAMVWYEAGKYAFRNRLDDKVTDLLDRALQIDPLLYRTVRENTAAALFANVIAHVRNGNRKAAEAWMATINRRYKDTDQGRQALAFWEGNTKAMLEAARDAERRTREAEEERKRQRLAAAKEKEDKDALARIEKEEKDAAAAKAQEEAEDKAAATAASANPQLAKADELVAKGRVPYSKAMGMPPTDERNRMYDEAIKSFKLAVAIYAAWVEKHPNDEDASTKMVEANKMKFACEKYRTAF